MSQYDVVVIGAGPGGYVGAIRCAQLGMKTACIDSMLTASGKPTLGGTCLNVGCIPSKALLDSSHHFEHISKHAGEHGISVSGASIDVATMMKRKDKVVQTLTLGVASLLKKNKVDVYAGHGRFVGTHEIEIASTQMPGVNQRITGKHIIIATGSVPARIPPAPVDQNIIVDSTGALAFASVPQRLGVIGAGVIGLELGSVWRRLGSKVTVLEALDSFLPAADKTIADEALKALTKQGLEIMLGAKVTKTSIGGDAVTVTFEQKGAAHEMVFDKLVVAVGRKPNTEGLNLEAAGLKIDARGFVEVDANCCTSQAHVYAIGDVVRGPMLAHKASEEGVAVAERIAGQKPHLDFNHVPWVIYTWPEIAWVGKTEAQLRAEGRDIRIGQFPFMGSGRAKAMGETTGMVKMIADANNDHLLGVHIFGANASELVAEAVLAMTFEGSSEDLALTIHAHPTLAEAMHEAALAVSKRAIHF
ncbi:MAG: dihydrolipoyl dehydrogenase [Gammaproteobacteria bacterium]